MIHPPLGRHPRRLLLGVAVDAGFGAERLELARGPLGVRPRDHISLVAVARGAATTSDAATATGAAGLGEGDRATAVPVAVDAESDLDLGLARSTGRVARVADPVRGAVLVVVDAGPGQLLDPGAVTGVAPYGGVGRHGAPVGSPPGVVDRDLAYAAGSVGTTPDGLGRPADSAAVHTRAGLSGGSVGCRSTEHCGCADQPSRRDDRKTLA